MIMADVLKIVLLIVATMLVFQAHWIASFALFPKKVEECAELYSRPIRLTVVGLLVAGPIVLLGVFLAQKTGNNPLKHLVVSIMLGAPAFLALFGSAGLATRIGQGMNSAAGVPAPWKQTMRGGIVLTLCYLLPFAGWFFLTGWTLISGFGATVIVFVRKSAKPEVVDTGLASIPTEPPKKQ